MTDLAAHVGRLSALGLRPETQFLYYAWPCLDNRAGHGQQVSRAHLDEVAALIHVPGRPRRSLLRYVFPDAYRGIGQAAEALHVNRWTQAAVERYFLIDHDRHLDAAAARGVPKQIIDLCRVFVGKLVSLAPLQFQPDLQDTNRIPALNPLRLPCRVGSDVAVHGITVVDVLKIPGSREGGR